MTQATDAPIRRRYNALPTDAYHSALLGKVFILGDQWALSTRPFFGRTDCWPSPRRMPDQFDAQLRRLTERHAAGELPLLSFERRTVLNDGYLFDVQPIGIDHTVDAALIACVQRAQRRVVRWRVATLKTRTGSPVPTAVAFTLTDELVGVVAGRETVNDQPWEGS